MPGSVRKHAFVSLSLSLDGACVHVHLSACKCLFGHTRGRMDLCAYCVCAPAGALWGEDTSQPIQAVAGALRLLGRLFPGLK